LGIKVRTIGSKLKTGENQIQTEDCLTDWKDFYFEMLLYFDDRSSMLGAESTFCKNEENFANNCVFLN